MRTAACIEYIRPENKPKPMDINSINLKQLVKIRELLVSKMAAALQNRGRLRRRWDGGNRSGVVVQAVLPARDRSVTDYDPGAPIKRCKRPFTVLGLEDDTSGPPHKTRRAVNAKARKK